MMANRAVTEGCPLGQFPCGNMSVCLPQVLQCNGHRDCKNGADEEHCGEATYICLFHFNAVLSSKAFNPFKIGLKCKVQTYKWDKILC